MRFWSFPWTITTAFVAVPAAGNHQPRSVRASASRLLKLTSSWVASTYAGVFFSGSRVTRVTPSAYFPRDPEVADDQNKYQDDRHP